MQVHDNGIISLDRSFVTSHTVSLPLPENDKVIAPFWANIDIRNIGNVYYRETTDPSLLSRATSEIRATFPKSKNVTITSLFIVTWDSVGYYYRHNDKVGTMCMSVITPL